MCYVCDAERHTSRRGFLSLTATGALAGLGLSAIPALAAGGKGTSLTADDLLL